MARNLFGGTTADAAEDSVGARVPGATGTVWNGLSEGATQVTDLRDQNNGVITTLTADANGMVPPFYGPDGTERLYADFGAGRVALVATNVGERFKAHMEATDPHGDRQAAADNLTSKLGQANGIAPLDASGLIPLQYMPSGSSSNVASIDSFMSETPFYIAHRGSGMEYPEHTMAAYEAALTSGVKAIEVSVCVTADGVPVCMHDPNLDRTTTGTGPMADMPYASLINTVKVDLGSILGQGWADQPLTNLRDVLDRFMGRVVIFLEPKTNAAIPIVQKMLQDYYPNANQSVVWKNYYLNPSFTLMKERGFKTWAYVDAGTTDAQMDAAFQPDYWGVPSAMTDVRKQAVVARGKKVICWEVHRRSQRDVLVGLGVQGMMAAQYKWLSTNYQILKKDNWASAVKAPGDMGRFYYDGTRDLKYAGNGEVYFNVVGESALIGSCSLPSFPTNGYRMTFDMKYEGTIPTNEHAGVAFGKADDSTYLFNTANSAGGYHMVFRGSGSLELYSHTAGVTSGTSLATAASAAPVANQWMSFRVDVTPALVSITRTDVTPNVTVSSTNGTYRGGYVHVSGGNVGLIGNRPRWRNLTVNAL
ncbi:MULTISPECIES: glycerophosphodiester phosphodiesterase [unclassified Streptomyces]|uniref:glycerophosphodiester phosphodiesterase n=1 Tax=unclassified Streptomyces TaxID=2593676 RepID=UPI0007C74319|nr:MULTISPECIES: glycerophosphodiester phosphodiesterase [unclassified Streptomyces]